MRPASAVWDPAGETTTNFFGFSVATAGDVNGDGFADVIVGAYANTSGTGKAYLYLGGPRGLSTASAWDATGETTSNYFGYSLSTAGDVNGDGFADVVVGAFANTSFRVRHTCTWAAVGRVPLLPRQLRSDLSAPISIGGPAFEQQFRLALTLRSPMGRVWRKLEWQVALWGGTFATTVNPIESDSNWFSNPVVRTLPVNLPEDLQHYVWRARVKYHPAQSPFMAHGPWVTLSSNGLFQTDLFSTSQVAPAPCGIPDEELYITTMTIDGNGKPVVHSQYGRPLVLRGGRLER